MTTFVDPVQSIPRGGAPARQRKARYGIATLLFVPPVLDRDGICAAQVRTGAGDLAINGAMRRAVDGVAYLDLGLESFGRCVGLFSTGNLSALSFSLFGFDYYRQPMLETLAGPNNSTVASKKAFFALTRVSVTGTIGTAVEVGTVDKFGLPMVLKTKNRLTRVGWDDVAAENGATFVAGDTTSPATATTGDPRGTVVPSSAADGVRELCVQFYYDDITRLTRLGVRHYPGPGVP
jgi:hypothetical protein